jgi:hypothetical protein
MGDTDPRVRFFGKMEGRSQKVARRVEECIPPAEGSLVGAKQEPTLENDF